ncbi:transcription factor bHLH18-like [Apium graveolens]|uniref:transcription factor bHLH18-like n=1 Tax=Apium graveolens TaxID=4045 RepID=UPI003D79E2BA
MDFSSTTLWLSELEMDDPMIVSDQSQMSILMSSLEESMYSSAANPISMSPQESTPPPVDSSRSFFRSENNSKGPTPPVKSLKTPSQMIPKPSSTIISFHSAISETAQYDGDHVHDFSSFLGVSEGNRKAATTTRNPLQAQDHVIAERQRRERLSQMFVQLSSLVPGLKKIDKASVLGEAANYIKQLQGRVKTLEEKVIEKDGEAIVAVDRSRPRFDEESSSSGEDNFADYNNQSIPEIEVRISETEVFLRIHSKQIPGMAVKMLSEIEKLHMIIISSSVMPFANDSLLVTVIAQMNVEFCMTAHDLMKRLQFAALKLGQEYAC